MIKKIFVDYGVPVGNVKPMHACGAGPKQGGKYLSFDATEEFKDIGIPCCRLHDIEGAYSMMQFVDVHNIFQNFDADVDDPAAYNFEPTDDYLRAIKEAGAEIFYRLGSSIEHFKKKMFIFPPKDYLKFAKICEHIIRHYNYGWNNGQYWEIKYWEIWNEPESAGMWQGSREEFYEFYRVVANHLKKCFPELKIGGYSAVGFYTETRENVTNPWFKTIVPTLNGFMRYITAEETKAPLDFFSWHCYAERPEEVKLAAEFVRKYFDDYGFNHIESFLTEYNTFDSLSVCPAVIPYYGAEVAATLIEAQNSPLDMLFYYDLRLDPMNGVFTRAKDYYSAEKLHGYYALKAFGDLYRLKTQYKTSESDKEVYVLAAADGDKQGVMLAIRGYQGEVSLKIENRAERYAVYESTYEDVEFKEIAFSDDRELTFNVKKDSIYYLCNK